MRIRWGGWVKGLILSPHPVSFSLTPFSLLPNILFTNSFSTLLSSPAWSLACLMKGNGCYAGYFTLSLKNISFKFNHICLLLVSLLLLPLLLMSRNASPHRWVTKRGNTSQSSTSLRCPVYVHSSPAKLKKMHFFLKTGGGLTSLVVYGELFLHHRWQWIRAVSRTLYIIDRNNVSYTQQ